ncbi:MAG: fumarylacetoacetate hydrolase [Pedosphaera sp.]|nr:fumarylacetoacetate hydrolase [Pedosphaera sp.]MSU44005.1 fumarylacetoacetate hydrolase [Pedosphaera sp.]
MSAPTVKICRFQLADGAPRAGLVAGSAVLDLTAAGIERLTPLIESEDAPRHLAALSRLKLPRHPLRAVRLLAPVEQQEVWAAGVTYLRSKKARMDESEFSATAYDRVYEAPRPELFFKSLPEKVVGHGEEVGIRRDARWNVPEPELVLVITSRGRVAGYTIGNDMSSRDIEGENLLYLPQAKVYHRSCASGPFIVLGATEAAVRRWTIGVEIRRRRRTVFKGQTSVGNIKRGFDELAGWLCRSQHFPHGALLLTGTGVVPGDEFTLAARDVVRITISGIGVLENTVAVV